MSGNASSPELLNQLRNGIESLGFNPGDHPVDKYLAYVDLLATWNKTYNLTAIDELQRSVSYHVLDSLSVLPFIRGKRCLDIGSGAGLPGLVLALARPDHDWVLVDSNAKKIRFINQAIIELKLNNIEAELCRIEEYDPEARFDCVTARAWGKLDNLYKVTGRLLSPGGNILAMKGPNVKHELASLDKNNVNYVLHNLDVPGVEGKRCLVEITALPSCK